MTDAARIAAIRAVRIAAHDLANVCGAIVGGVPLAIAIVFEDSVAQPTRGICSKALADKAPGQP